MTQVQTHARQPVPGVENMLAISSGKGGVGKSTVSVSLAVALAKSGLRVGLMDTDIYGPNVPGMLGVAEKPQVDPETGKIVPAQAHGVHLISMGMLVDAGVPVIWRGPMLAKMISQFLFQVDWAELDVLLLDLPPGTGDVQISLTQTAPLTGAVIVTTPSQLALEDVARGVRMFRETEVPLLGLIENMGGFVCSSCQQESHPFGHGGGEAAAERFKMPFLGNVPLEPAVRAGADTGTPSILANPDAPASKALSAISAHLHQLLENPG
ncbi:MAG: Mrp/NBP35 family ATP-binding protein [Candidatus Latescibacterota bacterium]|nr:Mrp/NBP35 family ATP-binding protein [Candidatus Latescibacterota bacterium]